MDKALPPLKLETQENGDTEVRKKRKTRPQSFACKEEKGEKGKMGMTEGTFSH